MLRILFRAMYFICPPAPLRNIRAACTQDIGNVIYATVSARVVDFQFLTDLASLKALRRIGIFEFDGCCTRRFSISHLASNLFVDYGCVMRSIGDDLMRVQVAFPP
ncbi:hypothetical protein [Variovorax boronicumulans]|uniref:hypothetical protein n=1 Tax=Variovorax boronicumulans TaxID=436515 RepID=UPI003394546A